MSTETTHVSPVINDMVKGRTFPPRIEVLELPGVEMLFSHLREWTKANQVYRDADSDMYLYGRTPVRKKRRDEARAIMDVNRVHVLLRQYRASLGEVAGDGLVELKSSEEDAEYLLEPRRLTLPGDKELSEWTFIGVTHGGMTDCRSSHSWTTQYVFTCQRDGRIEVEVSTI